MENQRSWISISWRASRDAGMLFNVHTLSPPLCDNLCSAKKWKRTVLHLKSRRVVFWIIVIVIIIVGLWIEDGISWLIGLLFVYFREFEVDSINFPGQTHRWRLSGLLQLGRDRRRETLLKDLALAARFIVITAKGRLLSHCFSVSQSLKAFLTGILRLLGKFSLFFYFIILYNICIRFISRTNLQIKNIYFLKKKQKKNL